MSFLSDDDEYLNNQNDLSFAYEDDVVDDEPEHGFYDPPTTLRNVSRRVSIPTSNNNNNNNVESAGIARQVLSMDSFGVSSAQSLAQRMGAAAPSLSLPALGGARRRVGPMHPTRSFLERAATNASSASNQLSTISGMTRREQHIRRLAARKALIQRVLNRRMLQNEAWGQNRIPNNMEVRQNQLQRRNSQSTTPIFNNGVPASRSLPFTRNNMPLDAERFLPQLRHAENELAFLSASIASPDTNTYVPFDSPEHFPEMSSSDDFFEQANAYLPLDEQVSTDRIAPKRSIDDRIDDFQQAFNLAVEGSVNQFPSALYNAGQDRLRTYFPLQPCTIDMLIEDSELINADLKGMVPESIFVAVGQMKPCG
jgi:hypothetical protein